MPIPAVLALALAVAQEPGDADLSRLVASVLPTAAEERFAAIDWQQSLMRARALASERERPMFLWIMNGHPFGCT